jgi:hypothetical protein
MIRRLKAGFLNHLSVLLWEHASKKMERFNQNSADLKQKRAIFLYIWAIFFFPYSEREETHCGLLQQYIHLHISYHTNTNTISINQTIIFESSMQADTLQVFLIVIGLSALFLLEMKSPTSCGCNLVIAVMKDCKRDNCTPLCFD